MPAFSLPKLTDSDPIGIAFGIALGFHLLLVFAIGFKLAPPQPAAGSIEVTLAQHAAQNTPKDSDYIAQSNQEGSGSTDKANEITTDRAAPLASPVFRDVDVPVPSESHQSQRPQPEQKLISTRGDSPQDYSQHKEDSSDQTENTPPQNAREIASLRAKLSHQRQLYTKIPRTLVLTTASARAADEAGYLLRWIQWVEKVGNENYPEEARQKKIFGAMRLAVALERDGNVASVEILQSSGQRVLDQAAVRIVRLAAPFEPFPAAIKQDRIEVIRTWNFVPGNLFSTSVD